VGSVIVLCGRQVGVEGFELDRPEHSQAEMPLLGVGACPSITAALLTFCWLRRFRGCGVISAS
jgi:hypothetical protein